MIQTAATAGGLFALFTFVHFVIDWVFQTHYEAMRKHNHPWIRARHCLIYTSPFIPLLLVLNVNAFWVVVCALVLFLSHFVEDTYIPVYLWAKYIRRVPEIRNAFDSKEFFRRVFVNDPLGKILMIAIDQIIHLLFLWVVVIIVMRG